MRVEPKTIMLATDGTRTSAVALVAACDVAHRTASCLHVAHIWGDPCAGLVPDGRSHAEAEALALGVGQAELRAAARLGATGSQLHVSRGHTADEILRHAAREGADLIVVGGRRPGFLADLLTARVSQAILDRTHIPVLLVPEGSTWPPRRVLVGFDGSEESRAAAHGASWIAAALGVDALAVHVLTEGAEPAGLDLRGMAEELAGDIAHGGELGLDAYVIKGQEVATTLLQLCSSGDGETLLAVGARSAQQLVREHLPLVAEDIARRSRHPVLLAPRSAPRPDVIRGGTGARGRARVAS